MTLLKNNSRAVLFFLFHFLFYFILSWTIYYFTFEPEKLFWLVSCRGDHFRFGSVFIKKSNQTEIIFFLKKKPKPGQTDRFRFGFLGKKPVQTGLARFFRFWLGFSLFGSVFSGFFSVSVRFCFFGFLLIKPKPNRTGRFFQNFNRFNRFFFFSSVFSVIFFRFSRFNQFFGFFAHP